MSATMTSVPVFVKASGVHISKSDLKESLSSVKLLKGKMKITRCGIRHYKDDEGKDYTTAVVTLSLVNDTKKCKDAMEMLIDRITTPSEHGWRIPDDKTKIYVIPDKNSGLTWTQRFSANSSCCSMRDDHSTVSSITNVVDEAEELPAKVQPTAPSEEEFPSLPVQNTPAKAVEQAAEQANQCNAPAKAVEQAAEQAAEQANQCNAPAKAVEQAAEQAAEQAEEDIPRAFAIYIDGAWVESFPTLEKAKASVIKNKPAWDLVPTIKVVEIRGLIVGPVVE
jgi:hypothetical protein